MMLGCGLYVRAVGRWFWPAVRCSAFVENAVGRRDVGIVKSTVSTKFHGVCWEDVFGWHLRAPRVADGKVGCCERPCLCNMNLV